MASTDHPLRRESDYDSRPDTRAHIARVRELLGDVLSEVGRRAMEHDRSKLVSPEVEAFDRCTPALARTTYGTPEYDEAKAELGVALQHHYLVNDHHPEHHERDPGLPDQAGIHAMDLIQLLEMLADWKAAGERHADGGDLRRSIEHNAQRFGYGPSMERLLLRTAEQLGWL